MSDDLERIAAVVARGGEADDVLRAVVTELAATAGVSWAGIAFVEGEALSLGPEAGAADTSHRHRVPVTFEGNPVAELWVDGDADETLLARIAELVGPQCLVGWDTGGVPWDA